MHGTVHGDNYYQENVSDIMSDVLGENFGHHKQNVGHVRQKRVFHIHCLANTGQPIQFF